MGHRGTDREEGKAGQFEKRKADREEWESRAGCRGEESRQRGSESRAAK